MHVCMQYGSIVADKPAHVLTLLLGVMFVRARRVMALQNKRSTFLRSKCRRGQQVRCTPYRMYKREGFCLQCESASCTAPNGTMHKAG
jgi:hypothetical protein